MRVTPVSGGRSRAAIRAPEDGLAVLAVKAACALADARAAEVAQARSHSSGRTLGGDRTSDADRVRRGEVRVGELAQSGRERSRVDGGALGLGGLIRQGAGS